MLSAYDLSIRTLTVLAQLDCGTVVVHSTLCRSINLSLFLVLVCVAQILITHIIVPGIKKRAGMLITQWNLSRLRSDCTQTK